MREPTVMRHLTQRGFTLIELMIVVAIVAIVSSLAYPAYTDSILKGKRAEGRTALTELMQQQERYMTQRNTYLSFSNSGGTTTPTGAKDTFKVFSGNMLTNSAYLLEATTCDAPNNDIKTCVKVVAKPLGTDAAADKLFVTSVGEKGCTGNKTSLCWK